MTRLYRAEVVPSPTCLLGESPVWLADSGSLAWTDIDGHRMLFLDRSTGNVTPRAYPSAVGAIVPAAEGGLALAVENGFDLIDSAGRPREHIEVPGDPAIPSRFNDGKCDAAGRFVAGTMAYDQRPAAGTLYVLDTDLSVRPILSRVTVSNGLAWSLDGSVMYYIDSAAWCVKAFAYDLRTARLSAGRCLVKFSVADGEPDGMSIDSEGHIWVAFYRGACVRRFTPDGAHVATVHVPVDQVTSCAFGGKELNILYITTASRPGGGASARPDLAGQLFAVELPVPGLPPHVFRSGGPATG